MNKSVNRFRPGGVQSDYLKRALASQSQQGLGENIQTPPQPPTQQTPTALPG
jgi:hypothetical protein